MNGCVGLSVMERDIHKLSQLKRPIVVIANSQGSGTINVEHIIVRDSVGVYVDLYSSAIVDTYKAGDTLR